MTDRQPVEPRPIREPMPAELMEAFLIALRGCPGVVRKVESQPRKSA